MPYTPELAERMRLALSSRSDITEKKMFGGYCWMLNGNMICGVEVGRYMFRVGKDLESLALSRPGATPMDITGKPMRGFIWVDGQHATGAALQQWIALAEQYVGTLPPK
ncbi:RNA methyltransferase [Ahniella affigens]|uniref:RNA methyltransferase n=1 Tax=Ahniella affigens TaxID=2021234 RepID=A0A2P1PNC5_9GAMM|nr:TfoX/Sxy family protein [Ahniella affigens]AVP96341.1 RNA methyltransferase [Ahniella affigens]